MTLLIVIVCDMLLGIAIPDVFSNPGISGLKNANPGIESRD